MFVVPLLNCKKWSYVLVTKYQIPTKTFDKNGRKNNFILRWKKNVNSPAYQVEPILFKTIFFWKVLLLNSSSKYYSTYLKLTTQYLVFYQLPFGYCYFNHFIFIFSIHAHLEKFVLLALHQLFYRAFMIVKSSLIWHICSFYINHVWFIFSF